MGIKYVHMFEKFFVSDSGASIRFFIIIAATEKINLTNKGQND